MCRLALLPVVVLLALVAPTPVLARPGGVSYKPPVDGPVVDPFRPPPHRWDPGNRGIDYATVPGTPVKAAADGEVVFAGQVGGRLHVVLLHADGIRTSYSFLAAIAVHRGDRLHQGQVVGLAGDGLHFGARAGDTYIDPASLFDDGPPRVHLVPDAERRPGTEVAERSGLVRFLGSLAWVAGAMGAGAEAVVREVGGRIADNFEELRGAARYADMVNPVRQGIGLARQTSTWWRSRAGCTPASVPPPPLPERRVAVLVGGLGSSSEPEDAAIVGVDAPSLGYADTFRFSYNGGSTRDTDYDSRDTTQDFREAGGRLLELLEQLHRRYPGEPVDILAHSQGGLVARSAMVYGYDQNDARFPKVANVITLGTPHSGSDLATAARMFALTESGSLIAEGVDASRLFDFDLTGASVAQMSETSWFLAGLNRTKLPDGVRFTSIGARADLVVPAVHTGMRGGRNVVVGTPGWFGAHNDLPASAAARREVALAAAGLGPTCESFGGMIADYWTSRVISQGEDALGAALYLAARRLDRYGVQDPPILMTLGRRR